jgi:HAD superfamily hydrolase (TIGR01509 family)
MKYEILLFDLGGVSVKDSSQVTQSILEAARMSVKELVQFFTTSPAMKDFDIGVASSQKFSENVVRDLKLSMSAPEFLELFRDWVGGLYEGTEVLLRELSQEYKLGCFSNNNEIWWPQIRDRLGVGRLMDYYFLSHKIGVRKPDLPAYEYVIQRLDIEPDRIAFFDDFEENVGAAQKAG